jgi:hypothetical protein
MGIKKQENTVAVFYGYGDVSMGVCEVKDATLPKNSVPIKRALCLHQINPGTPGRQVLAEDVDWTAPAVFLIIDRHETVDILIEKLHTIKDNLKARGL